MGRFSNGLRMEQKGAVPVFGSDGCAEKGLSAWLFSRNRRVPAPVLVSKKTVSVVPVFAFGSGKMVPTVPMSCSSSVPGPSWLLLVL